MVHTTPQVPDSGWISGACADDRRPQCSPAVLVLDVRAALATAGVEIDPAPNQMHIASIAAADLLRALGVAPATAPVR